MTTFSVALPHTKAVPVSALSVPCCLLVAAAFCVADPVWIYFLCSTICRAFPVCQGRLAQSVERKALVHRDFYASEALVPILRLLALPHREVLLVLSCSFSFRGCTCVISLHSWLVVMSLSLWRLLYWYTPVADPPADHRLYAWPASLAPVECKGLNLTSAFVMGNWIASFADLLLLVYRWTPFCAVTGLDPPKGGHRRFSSDVHLFPGAGPLYVPWAAGILHKEAHRNRTSNLLPGRPFE